MRWAPPAMVLLGLLTAGGLVGATDAGPQAVVQRLTDALVELARAGQEDFDARQARIRPVIAETHALERISPLVLGRHWRSLDDAQRAAFSEAFLEHSAATFAGRFDDYAGQSFVISGTEERPRGARAVIAELRRPDQPPIAFEFLLQESGAGWRIVNILVDGVSDLALRRAEYTNLLETDGFAALLEHLARQTRALREPPP